jgi:hypothetical protein
MADTDQNLTGRPCARMTSFLKEQRGSNHLSIYCPRHVAQCRPRSDLGTSVFCPGELVRNITDNGADRALSLLRSGSALPALCRTAPAAAIVPCTISLPSTPLCSPYQRQSHKFLCAGHGMAGAVHGRRHAPWMRHPGHGTGPIQSQPAETGPRPAYRKAMIRPTIGAVIASTTTSSGSSRGSAARQFFNRNTASIAAKGGSFREDIAVSGPDVAGPISPLPITAAFEYIERNTAAAADEVQT